MRARFRQHPLGHPCLFFFTTLDGCYLFLVATWPSPFDFFTTLDGCCLFLIVIWTSFFHNSGWVLFVPNLGRRPPLSPTLFYPQALLLTILLCIDYPTPPRARNLP